MVFFNVNGDPFCVYKIYMKFIGVWPIDGKHYGSTIIFSVSLLAQMSIILISLIDPVEECHPEEFKNAGNTRTVATILGVVQQISLRVTGDRMVPLIESTIEDWSSVRDLRERDIMKRHNRCGTLPICGATFFTVVIVTGWALRFLPFINKVLLINNRQGCALNDNSMWVNVIPVLNVTALLIWKLTNAVGITLFWSFAMHLSAQYKILKKKFQNFLLIRGEKESRKEFRRLVKVHNQLFDSCGYLEESFSVFVAILVIALQLCSCTIVLNEVIGFKSSHHMPTIVRCITLSFIFTVLYMIYYAADYLTSCSEEIGEVLRQCNWYEMSNESIINFSIVIARCQVPKNLTIVKMYKLNLSNFKYLINALYSCASCVVVARKDKDK